MNATATIPKPAERPCTCLKARCGRCRRIRRLHREAVEAVARALEAALEARPAAESFTVRQLRKHGAPDGVTIRRALEGNAVWMELGGGRFWGRPPRYEGGRVFPGGGAES